MKKKFSAIMALTLVIVLSLGLLGACGSAQSSDNSEADTAAETAAASASSEETQEETEEETEEEYDFDAWTYVTYTSVADENETLTFSFLPDAYKTYETEHTGTYEIVYYTTDVYGETIEKYAYVYLPYGYDADDTETKYNVIYFQHGGGCAPAEYALSETPTRILNNMFDPDHQIMEPCIIVFPTYLLESDENSRTSDSNEVGDAWSTTVEPNYYLEVVQDLIPAVESQYNVYCEDFSEEGIMASRDHRAWAGYSRGSVCTWYMLHNNLEYFAYWMPTGGAAWTEGSGEEMTGEELYEYLMEEIDANPDLDFFIYASSGGENDMATEDMWNQMPYLASQTDTFSFGTDPDENNFYYVQTGTGHGDANFVYSLAAAADILFK